MKKLTTLISICLSSFVGFCVNHKDFGLLDPTNTSFSINVKYAPSGLFVVREVKIPVITNKVNDSSSTKRSVSVPGKNRKYAKREVKATRNLSTQYIITTNRVYAGESTLSTNDYWNAGWRSISDIKPQVDSNHYCVAIGWENRSTNWIDRVYEIHEIPVPEPKPHRIYKYDISIAAMEYDELEKLIGFVSSDPEVKWMWDAAEILVETDPFFIEATNTIITTGTVSEEKVKKIIERAIELDSNPDTDQKSRASRKRRPL